MIVALRAGAAAAAAAVLAVGFLSRPAWTQPQDSLLDMVSVDGGTFRMGDSIGDGNSDEKPAHTVTVSGFWLSKYEVTVGQFRKFVEDSGYVTSAERQGGWLVWTGAAWERKQNASWKNPYFEQTESNAVVMVSWLDAAEFCNWLSIREHYTPFYSMKGTDVAENWAADGYRLPTEAEWEYAARSGGKPLQYAWGNGTPAGNVADETLRSRFPAWPFSTWPGYEDGYVYTAPVGSFPPNELGLYDLSGNVWEWCNDWHEPYTLVEQADPRGAATGNARTLRGGGWTDEPRTLRVSFRSGRLPNGRGVNSGFRPARSIRVDWLD